MAFSILNIEVIVFISVTILYMKLRKTSVFSIKLANGLITYLPPIDEDFTVLEKTN